MDVSIRNILFPTDFSDAATTAKDYAMSLSERFNATLHLMHVLSLRIVSSRTGTPWISLENELRLREGMADQRLEEQLPSAWAEKHRFVHASVVGFEVEEILKYVKIHQIDLIVIGTHGRTGLSHFLMGSVAEKVVRMATCPVFSVRKVEQFSADEIENSMQADENVKIV